MKNLKSKSLVTLLVLTLSLSVASIASSPGTKDDPLVTKSYIDDVVMPQLKSYVDSKTNEDGTSSSFNVVNVSKGQSVIGAKSCQMILRMGEGKIIATSKGGVCDVTGGVDLQNKVNAPSNHLLIVPLDDGRGIKMTTDGILMISGSFSIK